MKKIVLCLCMLLLLCSCAKEKNENELVVGMECDYAPFNWSQVEENEYTHQISSADYADGYDVQIASMIAKQLGKELRIVKLDWDSLIPSLNAGEIDCVIAGMTETPERSEAINFTTPYYESQMVVIVRADDDLVNIDDIQDLSGHNVLGQINTTYDEIIDQINGVNHMTPLDSYPRMVLSLQSKEADAITAEYPVAKGVVNANPDLAIVKFAEGKGFEVDTSVSIGVAKENTELLQQIQQALDTINDETRNILMIEATNRQPANEE